MINAIMTSLATVIADKRGVSAVEYTVIAALIIGVLVGLFATLGTTLSSELSVLNGSV